MFIYSLNGLKQHLKAGILETEFTDEKINRYFQENNMSNWDKDAPFSPPQWAEPITPEPRYVKAVPKRNPKAKLA